MTVALLLFLPETPRWLAKHGDYEESRVVIARLAGNDIPLDHPDVMKLYNSIQDALSLESAGGSFQYRKLVTGGQLQNYRRMLLCLAVDGFFSCPVSILLPIMRPSFSNPLDSLATSHCWWLVSTRWSIC